MQWFVFIVLVVFWGWDAAGKVLAPVNSDMDEALMDTDLVQAFVIFRHGDRTPDEEELELFTNRDEDSKDVFFPYGKKALTNRGKMRGYQIGKYLRKRYDGLISRLYLPDEISARSTEYARTQMTLLTALAAMYPPPPAQLWNPNLEWQPIPYSTVAKDKDDLLYWYYCDRYLWLRDQAYESPELRRLVQPYKSLFTYLTEKTGTNITTPEDVFYLDNLFQTLNNFGIKPPQWAEEVMPKIREMTKIEYTAEFSTPELTKLASGVLIHDILNATKSAIAGDKEQPKLVLYSAHENNVAALMSAARVYVPHQPNYGATFSLELRRCKANGKNGIAAVYARVAGGPGEVLPIEGCQNKLLCDYETFESLMGDVSISKREFNELCPVLSN